VDVARRSIDSHIRQGFDTIVAAGGDGTVSLAASMVAGTNSALGVFPAGTLNHFARDMGLPTDLEEAAKVVAEGRIARVDVGEVNGHLFLNNSSIGFYPTLVTERERRIKNGMSKTVALIPAAITALYRFPNTTVRVLTDEAGFVTRTPFVFVGNNRYTFSGLQAGVRTNLSDGQLQLCAVAASTRTTLVKAVVLAILGRIEANSAVLVRDVPWTRIETLRRHVRVALDGEVIRLASPLQYSIRPGALRVFVPGETQTS
jgi:diacylglycerol kinase family enzyme